MQGNVTFSCDKVKIKDAWICDKEDQICLEHNAEYMELERNGWLYYHEVVDISVVLPSRTAIKPNMNLKVYVIKDIKDKLFKAPSDWPIYLTGGARADGENNCCKDTTTPHFKELRFHQPYLPSQVPWAMGQVDWSHKGGAQYWDAQNYYGKDENFEGGYLGTIRYAYNVTGKGETETGDNMWRHTGVATTLSILLLAIMLLKLTRIQRREGGAGGEKWKENMYADHIADSLDLHLEQQDEEDPSKNTQVTDVILV